MAGFRVDRVKGGFMLREIHPNNKDARKLAVVGMSDPKYMEKMNRIFMEFLTHINDKYEDRKNPR